jgi:hypothetical protein
MLPINDYFVEILVYKKIHRLMVPPHRKHSGILGYGGKAHEAATRGNTSSISAYEYARILLHLQTLTGQSYALNRSKASLTAVLIF